MSETIIDFPAEKEYSDQELEQIWNALPWNKNETEDELTAPEALGKLQDGFLRADSNKKLSQLEKRRAMVGLAKMFKAYQNLPSISRNKSIYHDFLTTAAYNSFRPDIDHYSQLENLSQLFIDATTALQTQGEPAVMRLLAGVGVYAEIHPISDNRAKNAIDNLLPLIASGDSDVATLLVPNMHEVQRKSSREDGYFGITDYVIHCQTQQLNPENIHELMMISRDLPTTYLAKFEQNIQDGLTLMEANKGVPGGFINLRNMIHDQHHQTHEVITYLIGFATGKIESSTLFEFMHSLRQFSDAKDIIPLLDVELYSKSIQYLDRQTGKQTTSSVLDILHRLENNTQVIEQQAPKTEINRIDELINEFEKAKKRDDKAVALGDTLKVVNELLDEWYFKKKVGISPKIIEGLSWLSQQCFQILESAPQEELEYMYKEPWFQQVVIFESMTHSADMVPALSDFKLLFEKLASIEDPRQAYNFLAMKSEVEFKQLTKLQRKRGRTNTDAIWAGTVARELGLLPLKYDEWLNPRKHQIEVKEYTPLETGGSFLLYPYGASISLQQWDEWTSSGRICIVRQGEIFKADEAKPALGLGAMRHADVFECLRIDKIPSFPFDDSDRPELICQSKSNIVEKIKFDNDIGIGINQIGEVVFNKKVVPFVMKVFEMIPPERLSKNLIIKFHGGEIDLENKTITVISKRVPSPNYQVLSRHEEDFDPDKYSYKISFPVWPKELEWLKDSSAELNPVGVS